MINGTSNAVVFSTESGTKSYLPIVYWPEKNSLAKYAAPAVTAALSKKQCVLLQQLDGSDKTGEPKDLIACPLLLDEELYGVVVIQMPSQASEQRQSTIFQVKTATVWFEAMIRGGSSTRKNALVAIVELVASCLEHEEFQEAATDVMTDLASRLFCDRVSIGFLHGTGVIVEAVSHSAKFDRNSSLIRDIGEAMDEAMDQDTTIMYPVMNDDVFLLRCHTTLANAHKVGSILTIPFAVNGRIAGSVLIERPSDKPFDKTETEQFKQIVSMVGPVLEVRRRDEQSLLHRVQNSFKQPLVKLFCPGHIALKLGLFCSILTLAILTFVSGHYRVTGISRLTALTQRVVVAPQDGYIAEANVRPGDIVQNKDILGALDDKDLKLEYRRWQSQLEQLKTEHRDAFARHKRSKVAIIKARIDQAKARLNLVNEQLIRTRFTAPFDGMIVSGDLSQALGAPVEKGQVLFTVAPLDTYRVILKVDERDIGNVKNGQQGKLVLSGIPGKPLLFTVEKITPVSIAEEGRNYFQVEAEIDDKSDLLRPGMEGVAKIEIDQRKLIWILTHNLVDWWRLLVWKYRP
jgi:RND family efflux transporter MFP subunit